MGRFVLTDTPITGMVKMGDGVPGAIVILSAIFRDGEAIDPQAALGGLHHILLMDDMGIYGSHIWILYKYICNQDLRSMIALIRAHQLGFITETEIKNAIAAEERHVKHTLNIPSLVAQVEAELEGFQKAPVVQ